MSSSSTIDYGMWLIGLVIVATIVGGLTYVFKSSATNYGVVVSGQEDLVSQKTMTDLNNFTSELNNNVLNTQTSSSSFNTIWAGISVWKMFLSMPSMIYDGAINVFTTLNVSAGSFNLLTLVIAVIIIVVAWTLGFYLITGRRQ